MLVLNMLKTFFFNKIPVYSFFLILEGESIFSLEIVLVVYFVSFIPSVLNIISDNYT